MKDNRKTNIKVGITFLLAIVFMLIIFSWAKSISISSNNYYVKIVFKTVSGLEIGDNITINGVKKGKVKDIFFENNKVVVSGIIPNEIILKEDATASIEMMDLMGGKKVEIFPGYSEVLFDNNKYLYGGLTTDIPSALHLVGEVEDDLKSILKESRVLFEKINNSVLTDDFAQKTKFTIDELNSTLVKLNTILVNNENSINRIVKNSDSLTADLSKFVKSNSNLMNQTIIDSKQLINNLNSTVIILDTLLVETMEKRNNLGKILYDKELMQNVEISLEKLKNIANTLMKQIDSTGIRVEAKIKF